MIIVLAHSFAHRSHYTHFGVPRAVKFRHKQNIAKQSCSCPKRSPILFIYAAETRGKMQVLYRKPKSYSAHVIRE